MMDIFQLRKLYTITYNLENDSRPTPVWKCITIEYYENGGFKSAEFLDILGGSKLILTEDSLKYYSIKEADDSDYPEYFV